MRLGSDDFELPTLNCGDGGGCCLVEGMGPQIKKIFADWLGGIWGAFFFKDGELSSEINLRKSS